MPQAAPGRRQHLADGGYAKLADVARSAEQDVTLYVPVPTPRDPTRDRHARRPDDTDAVAEWRARMGPDDAKAIYRERAATAECIDAQARNRGVTRLLVRGVEKVKATTCWYGLAHTMACSWRLTPA